MTMVYVLFSAECFLFNISLFKPMFWLKRTLILEVKERSNGGNRFDGKITAEIDSYIDTRQVPRFLDTPKFEQHS